MAGLYGNGGGPKKPAAKTPARGTSSSYTPAGSSVKKPSTAYGPTTGISGGAFGNTPLPATKPYAPPPPSLAQQQAAQQRLAAKSGGGGGVNTNVTSYSSFGGGGGGGGGGGAPAPSINPEVDYLKEAGFMAQASALDKALEEFKNQDTAERGRYDVDFKKGLGDLGYRDENIDDDIAGNWDWNDVLTASGRGYQSNVNDFASRGMLESQGYFDSLKQLERSLEDQRGAMNTGRQNFKNERNEGMANYQNQDKAARDAARIAAIERLSSSLGLV